MITSHSGISTTTQSFCRVFVTVKPVTAMMLFTKKETAVYVETVSVGVRARTHTNADYTLRTTVKSLSGNP